MAERDEWGTATAELAVALPAVAVALGAVLAVGQVGVAQVQCVDAARAGARAAARGEPVAAVRDVARDGADGSVVDVQRQGRLVRVSVTRRLRLVLPRGPQVTVAGEASAQAEAVGSASVLVLAAVLVALVVAGATGLVGSAVVARHRAAAAADLAALAGADVLLGRAPGLPCAAADRVARANGAVLTGCVVTAGDAVVSVAVRPAGRTATVGLALGRARAGAG